MREDYANQVELLVRLLPTVGKEESFALKGGTAINLFYRDMPRLSIDIDLTYLPTTSWKESLLGIDEALGRILENIKNAMPQLKVRRIQGGSGNDTRLQVSDGKTQIKIETAPPARGTIHPPTVMAVTGQVEDQFGFAEMPILAFEDLFAGKLVAALDRQHPRDIFDVKLLYENEGLSDDLYRTLLAYIAFSSRPPHELLNPNPRDLADSFKKEFEGMTTEPVSLQKLEATQKQLFSNVRERLDKNAAHYLLTLHDGNPDFEVIGLAQAATLPAVAWKVENLLKLKDINPSKHAEQRKLIEELFS